MRHAQLFALNAVLLAAGGAGCETSKLPNAPSDLTSGLVVYEDANYQGRSAYVTADIRDLQQVPQHDCPHDGLNDCVTSIRARPQ